MPSVCRLAWIQSFQAQSLEAGQRNYETGSLYVDTALHEGATSSTYQQQQRQPGSNLPPTQSRRFGGNISRASQSHLFGATEATELLLLKGLGFGGTLQLFLLEYSQETLV